MCTISNIILKHNNQAKSLDSLVYLVNSVTRVGEHRKSIESDKPGIHCQGLELLLCTLLALDGVDQHADTLQVDELVSPSHIWNY